MSEIIIQDLQVHYCVGVTEPERSHPQRLLISIVLQHDVTRASRTDDLAHTIDYHAVARRLLQFGEGRSWKLLEKLAGDIRQMIFTDFRPQAMSVEIKKFIIPEARYVAVRLVAKASSRKRSK